MSSSHIGQSTAVVLISFAILVDFVEFILELMLIGVIVDPIIDICATLLFGMWFSHLGVSLMKKNPMGFLGTVVGKMIPFVEILPFWTFFVWRTINNERKRTSKL